MTCTCQNKEVADKFAKDLDYIADKSQTITAEEIETFKPGFKEATAVCSFGCKEHNFQPRLARLLSLLQKLNLVEND